MQKTMRLDAIRIDGKTQMREDLDQNVVKRYADNMRSGDIFPAIVVFNDGVKYWLADGFHRYFAYQSAKIKEVEVQVHEGTLREAQLYAVSVNNLHGLAPSLADRKKSALFLLNDPEWGLMADTEIAKRSGLHRHTVSDLRKEAEEKDGETTTRVYTRKDGTEVSMTLDKVGKKGKSTKKGVSKSTTASDQEVSKSTTSKSSFDEYAPTDEELEANDRMEKAERETMQLLLDASEPLQEAYDEIKRLKIAYAQLESRFNGIMAEKSEAIKMVKQLQKQLDRAKK